MDLSLFRENRVVNWHEHVWTDSAGKLDMNRLAELIAAADLFHMDTLVCSNPITSGNPPPSKVRLSNDLVYEAMKLYPNRIEGMCYVNPLNSTDAVEEIKRCVALGFIGVKLYNQCFISDPAARPVIELCAKLGLPILEHAGKLNFGHESQPYISDGTHFAEAAQAFPEAVFIYAHVGGGGDWQWSLKAIAPYPNIYADISGSVCDGGLVEETVEYLGAKRVLFGTDMSYCACVGKLLGANIPLESKKTVLNNPHFSGYLKQGGRA